MTYLIAWLICGALAPIFDWWRMRATRRLYVWHLRRSGVPRTEIGPALKPWDEMMARFRARALRWPHMAACSVAGPLLLAFIAWNTSQTIAPLFRKEST